MLASAKRFSSDSGEAADNQVLRSDQVGNKFKRKCCKWSKCDVTAA